MTSQNIDPDAVVQVLNVNPNAFKFKAPFAMCISGQSMSGKSEFIVRLLTYPEEIFDVKFEQVFYCQPHSLASRHNPIFEKIRAIFPSAQMVAGLPDITKLHLNLDSNHKLLIIDDLMEPFLNSHKMIELLSVEVHHSNISTIFTVQNFFAQSRFAKTLSRNLNYRCIFFNRLDLTEIRTISMQICHKPKFLLESFQFLKQEFPREPAYIVVDGHGRSDVDELFVRSQIFPQDDGEIRPIFFFPKKE